MTSLFTSFTLQTMAHIIKSFLLLQTLQTFYYYIFLLFYYYIFIFITKYLFLLIHIIYYITFYY